MATILHLATRAAKAPSLSLERRRALRRIRHWFRQAADHMVTLGGNADDLRQLGLISKRMGQRAIAGDHPKTTDSA